VFTGLRFYFIATGTVRNMGNKKGNEKKKKTGKNYKSEFSKQYRNLGQ
jgi:hypothetical protein